MTEGQVRRSIGRSALLRDPHGGTPMEVRILDVERRASGTVSATVAVVEGPPGTRWAAYFRELEAVPDASA